MAEWHEGWWQAASHDPSPNFDERPAGAAIDMVVIHYISLPPGQWGTGYPLDLFCNRLNTHQHPSLQELAGLRVSSHFFIARSGEVVQSVSTLYRAWHAGQSAWQGRNACNDFSIGIELEGDSAHPFDAAQYRSLEALCEAIVSQNTVKHWVGHSDIAPGRKSDPGPFFDWPRLLKKVAEIDGRVTKDSAP